MSKKISLREFQENLVQRLTTAQQGQTTRAALGIQAGREFWLVDLTDSGEIVPTPHLSSVPLTQSWFRGLANIRWVEASLLDLPTLGLGAFDYVNCCLLYTSPSPRD